jgi:hypothetical protein
VAKHDILNPLREAAYSTQGAKARISTSSSVLSLVINFHVPDRNSGDLLLG